MKVRLDERNELVFSKKQLKLPFITQNNIMLEYLEPELKKRVNDLENDYSFVGVIQKSFILRFRQAAFLLPKWLNRWA